MRGTITFALSAGALSLAALGCADPNASGSADRVATPIQAEDLARRVATLADDAMQGRAPGTAGGRRASAWIAEEMARVGLEPVTRDGLFQAVPIVEATLNETASGLLVRGPDGERALTLGEEAVIWTKRVQSDTGFEAADVVFVGYGAVAPEYDWNDYAGLDVRGKLVVMLVNDPGFAKPDEDRFTGPAMTYYGRWTYKFEEAARQGAAGALVIHETAPASYGWDVVRSSWSGPQLDLKRADAGAGRPALEGWLHRDAALALFDQAGLDFQALKDAAAEPEFAPVPLAGLSASAKLVTTHTQTVSRNVAGVLRGAKRPDEYVLYTAHWDHLGQAQTGEDRIFNGAVDNATGVASILEIAEAMAGRAEPLDRSVLFLAVTAEEAGLLGSDYFGENPLAPLSQIVGGVNIDALVPLGPTHDLQVIGFGASELEDRLARLAAAEGRVLAPDPNPEAGYYYRSDHVNFAKRGAPMLYAKNGIDHRQLGSAHGEAVEARYRAERYHSVADEYDPDTWDFAGMVEDLTLFHDLGVELANTEDWPEWYEGNEFRAIRQASRAGAGG
ncbi:MAG: M28 family metallopeptidase [Maricaulaceae bacterium]